MTKTTKITSATLALLGGIGVFYFIWSLRSTLPPMYEETSGDQSETLISEPQKPQITENTPLREVFALSNSESETNFNFAENANVSLRLSDQNNSLSVYVSPQNIPLDTVEVRLKFDPTQTTVQAIDGTRDFPDTSNSIFNNEEGWMVLYANRSPDSLIFDQESLFSQVAFQGTNSFSVVQNRSLAISNNTIIELNIQ